MEEGIWSFFKQKAEYESTAGLEFRGVLVRSASTPTPEPDAPVETVATPEPARPASTPTPEPDAPVETVATPEPAPPASARTPEPERPVKTVAAVASAPPESARPSGSDAD